MAFLRKLLGSAEGEPHGTSARQSVPTDQTEEMPVVRGVSVPDDKTRELSPISPDDTRELPVIKPVTDRQ